MFDVASQNSFTADYAGFGKFGNGVSYPKITEINDLIFMILLILHQLKDAEERRYQFQHFEKTKIQAVQMDTFCKIDQDPVVQKVDNTVLWINLCPVNRAN